MRRVLALGIVLLGLGAQRASADETRFEVVVLATIHAPWQFRNARFTPAHVRAALDVAHADVVGVESPPEWFSEGRYHAVTYEAQAIAVPFARAHKLPVVGIDWQDLPARERKEADMEASRVAGIRAQILAGRPLPLGMYGLLADAQLRESAEFFRSAEFDFDLVNGIGSDAYARRALAGEDVAAPGFGGRRNREIADRCAAAMEKHPGKRLVVVIGAGHKAVLDAMFGRMEGVRVLRWGKEVEAPSPEAVERAWTTEDLVAVLGHNLDGERSYFHADLVDLPRMRDLVRLLEERPGGRETADYFRARIATAEASLEKNAEARAGQLREAEAILDRLAGAKPAATLYPFPMDQWRMRYSFAQAVRLERARLRPAPGDLEALQRELVAGDAATSADLLAREFPRTLIGAAR